MKKDRVISEKIMEGFDSWKDNDNEFDVRNALCYVSGWLKKDYPEVSLALYQIASDEELRDRRYAAYDTAR